MNLDGYFWRQEPLRPIDLTGETNPLFTKLDVLAQREHLESTGVRQDWTVPVHEPVQAAKPTNALMSRPFPQVVGVGQHNVSAGFFDLGWRQGPHSSPRSDWHKRRRRYRSMCQRQGASARVSARRIEFIGAAWRRHRNRTDSRCE